MPHFCCKNRPLLAGWTVIASVPMLRGIRAVKAGRRAMFNLPGRSVPVDAAELMGVP
jgi:hypothetical protein